MLAPPCTMPSFPLPPTHPTPSSDAAELRLTGDTEFGGDPFALSPSAEDSWGNTKGKYKGVCDTHTHSSPLTPNGSGESGPTVVGGKFERKKEISTGLELGAVDKRVRVGGRGQGRGLMSGRGGGRGLVQQGIGPARGVR